MNKTESLSFTPKVFYVVSPHMMFPSRGFLAEDDELQFIGQFSKTIIIKKNNPTLCISKVFMRVP